MKSEKIYLFAEELAKKYNLNSKNADLNGFVKELEEKCNDVFFLEQCEQDVIINQFRKKYDSERARKAKIQNIKKHVIEGVAIATAILVTYSGINKIAKTIDKNSTKGSSNDIAVSDTYTEIAVPTDNEMSIVNELLTEYLNNDNLSDSRKQYICSYLRQYGYTQEELEKTKADKRSSIQSEIDDENKLYEGYYESMGLDKGGKSLS